MDNDGWREMTLGDFISLQRGHDLTASERRPGTVPVMGSAGITGYHDTPLASGPGVTVGRSGVGSMGVVSYSPVDYWPHNTVLYVTDFHGNDERFTYYFLQHLDLRRFNSGSAQASLNRNYIYPLRIRVPRLREQKAIAHVLGVLDDKIELNRRMNETLEAITRAIFQSWFVDFQPVRAKMNGRKPEGMDAATAKMFPDGFEKSELGPIPEGWKTVELRSQIEAVRGLSYKGSGLADTGVPMHNLNSVYEGGGYKYEGIKFYAGEYEERHGVQPGDVIVTNTEQGHDCLLIGYAAVVPHCFGSHGIFSHHLYRVRPSENSSLTPHFLVYLLNSSRMHEVVSGYGNGTTVNMLPLDGLEQPVVVLPPRELICRFDALAQTALARCEQSVAQNDNLALLRDSLLLRLLSGDLAVKNVDVAIAHAHR